MWGAEEQPTARSRLETVQVVLIILRLAFGHSGQRSPRVNLVLTESWWGVVLRHYHFARFLERYARSGLLVDPCGLVVFWRVTHRPIIASW
jgi:hypothetical protein